MTIRTITLSTLYPSSTVPYHGIFVEHRIRHLLAHNDVTTAVIAPVPWFPSTNPRFGRYAKYASIPAAEMRYGIDVLHPRYPLIPTVGMTMAPPLLASALIRFMKQRENEWREFDLIDAHYFYPDGIAAVILGHFLRMPVVITARGTDINLIPNYWMPKKWILWAAKRCAGIITVSESLRSKMLELGVDASKIRTLRNGVDLDVFRPLPDRRVLRRKLDVEGPTLLSVGHLIERKGHHIVVEALQDLPGWQLLIAGEGEMRGQIEEIARRTGVAERVRFVGAVSQEQLVEYYNAADALILASSREGMANVLLESIACGTPVIGTAVWGTPEVISERRAGVLMTSRTPQAVVNALNDLMTDLPSADAVRSFAMRFSWNETSDGQIEVFRNAIDAN